MQKEFYSINSTFELTLIFRQYIRYLKENYNQPYSTIFKLIYLKTIGKSRVCRICSIYKLPDYRMTNWLSKRPVCSGVWSVSIFIQSSMFILYSSTSPTRSSTRSPTTSWATGVASRATWEGSRSVSCLEEAAREEQACSTFFFIGSIWVLAECVFKLNSSLWSRLSYFCNTASSLYFTEFGE